MELPTSGKGIVIATALVVIAIIVLFTTGLWAAVLGALIVAVVAYVVYVGAIRLHRWATGRSSGPSLRRGDG